MISASRGLATALLLGGWAVGSVCANAAPQKPGDPEVD